jgi:LCP family protein required for cell wall assembly
VKRASFFFVLLAALVGWILVGMGSHPTSHAQVQTEDMGHEIASSLFPGFPSSRPFFIAVIGSDARPGVCEPVERCLSDSLHIIGINPKERSASIVGIPRDSYINIPGVGTRKINESLYNGGPELVVQTLEELSGVRIDDWFLTSFEGFRHLIEEIGGIRVEIPYPMSDEHSGASFEAGPAVLDGAQALAFARNRHDAPNGDFSRTENQGRIILAALAQLRQEVRKDPTRLFTWLIAGAKYVQTDLSMTDLFELGLAALAIDPKNIVNRALPGGIGTAGGASIVTLGGDADAVFADLADDGLLEETAPDATTTETPTPAET